MKNKGFIATSLIYSFFLVFLALLAVILNSYIFNNNILEIFNKAISSRINKEIDKNSDDPTYILNDLDILHIIPNTGTPNFNMTATSDEGVYVAMDNQGKSYYYRGDVDYNYVVFGSFIKPGGEAKPMYWRIIRINGDGSLRLIYEGYRDGNALNTEPYAVVAWNSNNVSNGLNLAFDRKLQEFYTKHFLETKYEKYISDSGFCSTKTSTVTSPADCTKTKDKIICAGVEKNITDFSDYDKIVTFAASPVGISPSLECAEKDQYSASNDNGNGRLTYPIGLISSNEIVMAGGKYATTAQMSEPGTANVDFYLFKEFNYWTMSEYEKTTNSGGGTELMSINYLNGTNAIDPTNPTVVVAFGFSRSGFMIENSLNNATFGLYPVINVKEEYISTLEGEGTITEPFIGNLDR